MIGDSTLSWIAIRHEGIETGSVNILDLSTLENRRFDLPGRPGFAIPNGDSFWIGLERDLMTFRAPDSLETFATGFDAGIENTIINDATWYQDWLIFGLKDLDFRTPKAGLYAVNVITGCAQKLLDNQICSNGKLVLREPCGLRLLNIDSPLRNLMSFSLNLGDEPELGDERVVIDFSHLPGVPDGMCWGRDKNHVIIAFYDGDETGDGLVAEFCLSSGQIASCWSLPGAPRATCPCVWSHSGRQSLIVTSASGPTESHQNRNQGSIFIADLP